MGLEPQTRTCGVSRTPSCPCLPWVALCWSSQGPNLCSSCSCHLLKRIFLLPQITGYCVRKSRVWRPAEGRQCSVLYWPLLSLLKSKNRPELFTGFQCLTNNSITALFIVWGWIDLEAYSKRGFCPLPSPTHTLFSNECVRVGNWSPLTSLTGI